MADLRSRPSVKEMFETYVQWELSLLHNIQDASTKAGDLLWTVITAFGEGGIFWILLSLSLILFPKTRKAGLSMGLALLFGVILGNGILKNLFARPRPYDLDPTLSHRLAFGKMTTDFSFPSGHTLCAFEGAFALFLRNKKWGAAALTLAFFISLSRLFLLVHYPSDLVAGALLGIFLGFAATKAIDLVWKKWEKEH